MRTVELSLESGTASEAVGQLELLSAESLDGPAKDLVQLTLGELRLRQFYSLPFDQRIPGGGYSPAASNALASAQVHFNYVITNFTNSTYLGKAWINKAWCDWQLQQWEAAARGLTGRLYAYGDTFDGFRCNTFETHIRRTTPIGVL